MNVDELDTLFNKRSGMMGMTGFGDLREVHRLVAEGNEDAKLALDVYVHRIVSYIGNYTYQMGGCDVITFTAARRERRHRAQDGGATSSPPFGASWTRRRTRSAPRSRASSPPRTPP